MTVEGEEEWKFGEGTGRILSCWTTMFEEASSCFKASDQADKKAFDPEYVASN